MQLPKRSVTSLVLSPATRPPRALVWLLPWFVLVVSLALTLQWWGAEERHEREETRFRTDLLAGEAHQRVVARLQAYAQRLGGVRDLALAIPGGVASLAPLADTLDPAPTLPGALGFGFVAAPGSGARSFFHAGVPAAPAAADLPLQALRMIDRLGGAAGTPMHSFLSPRLPGSAQFLYFQPLPAARDGASGELAGWLYVPIDVAAMLADLQLERGGMLTLRFHADERLHDDSRLYGPPMATDGGALEQGRLAVRRIEFGGATWALAVQPGPMLGDREREEADRAMLVAFGGTGVSILLALITWFLLHRRAVTWQLAQDMAHALRERETRYRQMFDDNASIIYLLDPDSGRIVEANRAAAAFWGYAPAYLAGKPISEISLAPEESLGATLRGFAERRLHRIETRHRLANGEVRDMVLYGGPLTHEARTLVYIIAHDISGRKEASAAQLRTVLDASPDAMLMVGGRGQILSANLAASQVFGYSVAELCRLTVEDLVPADVRGTHHRQREQFQAQPRARAMGASRSLKAARRDGSEFPVEISLMPLEMDGEKVIIAVVQDITERRLAEERLQASEKRWKYALEGAGDGVWDWDIPADALSFSPRTAEILGCAIEELGSTWAAWLERVHADDRAAVESALSEYFYGRRTSFQVEARLRAGDDSWRWILIRGNVVLRDADGQPRRMIGTQSDVTERKASEEALQLAAMVYQYSAEAMMVTDAQNNIVAINPAFTRLTGFTAEDAIGRNPRIMSSGRQDKAFYEAMWQTIRATGTWQGEIRNRRKNGEEFVERLTINTIFNEKRQVHRYVALFSDITEKTRFNELMWQQANFDSLTGLPNRRMSRDRLEQEIRKAQRSGHRIALLFIDVDRFKEVNDSLGHQHGDDLLKQVAARIGACVRSSDTVARLGGDEFTIIMSDLTDAVRAQQVAANIIEALDAPITLGDERIYTSVSVGVTLFPDDAGDADTLLKNADQAMYAAKAAGRGRYCFFTPAMQAAMQDRIALTRDLHVAIEERQFEVWFQPILDLRTGAVVKAEALLRWHHPERGQVSPASFVPVAESTGLILQIGSWVFEEAVRCARDWAPIAPAGFRVGVNVSPAQLHSDSQAPHGWLEACREYGVAPSSIVVEITEGLLLKADGDVRSKLQALHDAGVQIAIDDFGTGYSSLSYLKKFDIDYIKIDRSFVRDLETDPNDLGLSEAIVLMAHKLGLKVIAEGIETDGQRALLAQAACDFGQGYLFARPMPAAAFEDFLRAQAAQAAPTAPTAPTPNHS